MATKCTRIPLLAHGTPACMAIWPCGLRHVVALRACAHSAVSFLHRKNATRLSADATQSPSRLARANTSGIVRLLLLLLSCVPPALRARIAHRVEDHFEGSELKWQLPAGGACHAGQRDGDASQQVGSGACSERAQQPSALRSPHAQVMAILAQHGGCKVW